MVHFQPSSRKSSPIVMKAMLSFAAHWRVLIAAMICLTGASRTNAAAGDEHWDTQFGWPGVTNSVYGLGYYNGTLYAGGNYFPPGGTTNNQVDVWDGVKW